MEGGVIQLVAVGAQDQFISGSPEISYFKMVYKRHTNFSMESVQQTFNNKPTLGSGSSQFICRIGRVADMLKEIYFQYQLPDIYSNQNLRFRWIENISQYIIYKTHIRLDTQLIDELYGEWMDVWNELTLSEDQRNSYNKMTGNTVDFNNPRTVNPYVIISNNDINFEQYPEGSSSASPSIRGRRFYLPLQFWFTKNPGLALPLIALQYQNLEVTVELRDINQLYQVYDIVNDIYVSPTEYQTRYPNNNVTTVVNDVIVAPAHYNLNVSANNDVSIKRFLVPIGSSYESVSGVIDINATLECNYIFLDEDERKVMALNSHDYLIERVYRLDKEGILELDTIDLILQNPVKELVWITRRGDTQKYNNWSNFTNSLDGLSNNHILNTARLLWNGMDRFEDKPAEYFNYVQPFQHHTRSPRDGIYAYSFALYPEKIQPSGSFNASTINRIQMYVTTNPVLDNYEYQFVVYSRYYNIFRVVSGSGGMVYAN